MQSLITNLFLLSKNRKSTNLLSLQSQNVFFFKLFLQIANIRNINIPALPANVLACPYPNKTPLSADVKAIDPFFNTPTKDNKTTDINTTNHFQDIIYIQFPCKYN